MESLPYAQIILFSQNMFKQATTRDLVAATGTATQCLSLLQDVLVFYRKLVEGHRKVGRVK